MKNPHLIIDDKVVLNELRVIIAEFELKYIHSNDVRVLVKYSLISLALKLERIMYAQEVRNKKLTIKLNELAALRICFHGAAVALKAEQKPYLWPLYNHVMVTLSQHISSC